MKPKFAVRADHDKRVYEVYDITTGHTVESFTYKATNELDRGVAAGRAGIARERLNDAERKRAKAPPWGQVKGDGFDPDTGGFAEILIDGKRYPARVIAAMPAKLADMLATLHEVRRKLRVPPTAEGEATYKLIINTIAKAEEN
jgi:hypothetical protein